MPRRCANLRDPAAPWPILAAQGERWQAAAERDGALNYYCLIKSAQATVLLDAGCGSS
jgi:hypothetical protein